ncbi:ABC transporter permease [Nocardioides sp. GY 10127]|uniref:ABC transporter permease n=1 Tax=Nocardioides sp. GY 10127 TaxID=2569762 RepID=UPI0010A87E33|nr:ABC transporter permease [Nocardioides sp. GY 10127]TIC79460.1 ABC transporter permease [Nocardioides sp. GY 10127]
MSEPTTIHASPTGGAASGATGGASAPPPPTAGTPEPGSATRKRGFRVPSSAALVAFLLLEVAFFSARSPYFLNWDNWTNILTALSVVGVVSCGMTFLLVAGQMDLSVGSGIAFTGLVLAELAPRYGLGVAVPVALLTGILIGVLNGFVVTVVGVNALITTLGTMAVFRGLTLAIGHGQNIAIDGIGWGIARPFLNVPVTVYVFLAAAVLASLVLAVTVYGRSLYTVGANAVAARLVGLPVGRTLFLGFVISGLCVGLGGLMNTSLVGSTSGTTGTGLELAAITAVILGGTSLSGGKGGILGTVLGLLIVGVLTNGLTLMNVDSSWQQVATGILLIAAVAFDRVRQGLVRES